MTSNAEAQGVGFLVGLVAGVFTGGVGFGLIQAGITGMTIGSLFGDTRLPDGPRIKDTKINDSTYGVSIPRIYGTEQVTANIIWLKNNELEEVAEEVEYDTGWFSSSTQTVYKYYATFAVLLCEGVVDDISKIWANEEIIYNSDTGFGAQKGTLFKGSSNGRDLALKSAFDIARAYYGDLIGAVDTEKLRLALERSNTKIRFYNGTLDQEPDSVIVEALGVDKASAYRGVSYIVFENVLLTTEDYNNQIPTLRFELTRTKLGLEEKAGDVRTFAAKYLSERNSDSTTAEADRIFTNCFMEGSVLHEAGLNTFDIGQQYTGVGNYAFSYGVIHTAILNPKAIQKPVYHYQYVQPNGTVITHTNKSPLILINQAHDLSSLSVDNSLSDKDTSYKQSTTLIKEDFVEIFPWDLQDNTDVYTSINPIVKPIQNLPNWFIVARGSSLSVGFIKSGRLVLFNTRVNLNEEYESGELTYKCDNLQGPLDGSDPSNTYRYDNESRLCAAFLGGIVYVYMKPPTYSDTLTMHFNGIIAVEIANIDGAELLDILKIPSASTVELGGNSYFSENSVDTFLYQTQKSYRFLDADKVKWYKDICINTLAYDYEEKKLFAGYVVTGSDGNNPLVSNYSFDSSIISNTNITDKSPNIFYELDGAIIDQVLSQRYITSNASYVTTDNTSTPVVARVYEDKYFDLGYITYISSTSQDELLYVVSGGNSYLDLYKAYSTTAEEGYALQTPLSQGNNVVPLRVVYVLPDGSGNGSEKINLISCQETGYATTSVLNFSFSPPFIFKAITTLRGDITSLYNVTSGVQLGEIITAEIERTKKIDTSTDVDLSNLDEFILGYAIKDRGSISSISKGLQDAYLFDLTEVDYKINGAFRKDKSVVRTITYEELGAMDATTNGNHAAEIKLTTIKKDTVPSRYNVTYRDPSHGYEPTTLSWVDQNVEGEVSVDIKVPVCLLYSDAYNLMQRIFLAITSARRGNIEFQTSYKHSDLEVNDFVTLQTSDGNNYTVRITSIEKGRPALVKCVGVVDYPANYSFDKTGLVDSFLDVSEARKVAQPVVVNTLPFTASDDGIGYYVGAYSLNSTEIFKSVLTVVDNHGDVLSRGKSLLNATPVGYCTTSLPVPTTEGDFDYTTTLTFTPISFAGAFIDSDEASVLGGVYDNTYLYGSKDKWEIVKIVSFTDNGDGSYTADGILRGYKGTSHLGQHKSGDFLIGMNIGSMKRVLFDKLKIGTPADFILRDPSPLSNTAFNVTISKNTRLPMPPINLGGYKQSNGDFYIEWFRQARHTIEWINSYDIPLDEATETYQVMIVDITNNNLIVDSFTVSDATNFTYDVALQTAAFGMEVSQLTFSVRQYSQEIEDYGYPAELTTV